MFEPDLVCPDNCIYGDDMAEGLKGQVKMGCKCHIQCKPGFKMTKGSKNTFNLGACDMTWYLGLTYSIFEDLDYKDYGCSTEGTCDDYPRCEPE